MEKLHVGYSAQADSLAPIWKNTEAGIFKKHDLDVELLFIPGGPTAEAALMSGDFRCFSSALIRDTATTQYFGMSRCFGVTVTVTRSG